jgi:thiosulfate/3-mercaptopyruvate sulfurtransferase
MMDGSSEMAETDNQRSPFVISADALQARLGEPGLRLVDASWYLPAQARNGAAEYAAAHIPGAVFFDQDKVVDPTSPLPHALPSPETFAAAVGAMGIGESDSIVVYDGAGMFAAPRVWWMFRIMGATDVKVLDGGFDRWKAEGRPVTDAPAAPQPAVFTPRFDAEAVASLADMRSVIEDGSAQIADARPRGRFTGQEPEPRAGIRPGHMPGAFNVPIATLSQDGRLKSLTELRQTLRQAGIDPEKPVVTTCGSGVTAAVITLALHSLGHTDNRLYDGSWSEWGSRDDTPVKTGEGIVEPATSPTPSTLGD